MDDGGTISIRPVLTLVAAAVAAAALAAVLVPTRPVIAPTAPSTATPSPVPAGARQAPPWSPPQAGGRAARRDPASTFAPQPLVEIPPPHFEGPFVYGSSFDGRPLLAYRLGSGPSARAIVGGIHGGYEWNTVALVSETLEYLGANPALAPEGVTLYVIPCANPDGYAAGAGRERGRMNGNGVDLNRNWDYEWQPLATHGLRPVDAGAYAFSEPETAALRDFFLEHDVEAAIFYHSAMGRVFYGVERERSATVKLARAVSQATGYPLAASVPGQVTTGGAIDWMSARGLAGIEVELTTHEDVEWERNLRGLLAFLEWIPSS